MNLPDEQVISFSSACLDSCLTLMAFSIRDGNKLARKAATVNSILCAQIDLTESMGRLSRVM